MTIIVTLRPRNTLVQATLGVGSKFWTVDFGGAFFYWSYCVLCMLSDTLGLRCMMFIFCVKEADFHFLSVHFFFRDGLVTVSPWRLPGCMKPQPILREYDPSGPLVLKNVRISPKVTYQDPPKRFGARPRKRPNASPLQHRPSGHQFSEVVTAVQARSLSPTAGRCLVPQRCGGYVPSIGRDNHLHGPGSAWQVPEAAKNTLHANSTAAAENIVDHRVDTAMNQWIASKYPVQVLQPGDSIDVVKHLRQPTSLWLGFQWQAMADDEDSPLHLDVMAFGLDGSFQCKTRKDMVYWGNSNSSMDALVHCEGGKEADAQTVRLQLSRAKIVGIAAVVFVVNIRDAKARGQCLGRSVRHLTCTVYDKFGDRHREIARVSLSGPFEPQAVALEMLRLVALRGSWTATVTAKPFHCSVRQLVAQFVSNSSRRMLLKGENCHIHPETGHLVCVGLSWRLLPNLRHEALPINVLVVCLDSSGKQVGNIICPHNPRGRGIYHHNKACKAEHEAEEKDTETVELSPSAIPAAVYQILFVAIIPDRCQSKGHCFREVEEAGFRVYTRRYGGPEMEICRHEILEGLSSETAVEFLRFSRDKDGQFGMVSPSGEGLLCDATRFQKHLLDGTWLLRANCQLLRWGDRFNVTRTFPGLRTASVGVGWENASTSDPDNICDLDLLVFCTGADGKMPSSRDFVYENNKSNKNGSVRMVLSSTEGGTTEGDDEIVELDLYSVRSTITQIVFVVYIYKALERQHRFALLKSGHIRIYDQTKDAEILRYNLDITAFCNETAIEFGRLIRSSSTEWVFLANPEAYQGTFQEITANFKRNVLMRGRSRPVPSDQGVLRFALGWDDVPGAVPPYDIDVLVLGLDERDVLLNNDYFIWHKHPTSPDGAIAHLGEFEDAEDRESVAVRLPELHRAVRFVVFVVRIFEAAERRQHFGHVPSVWLRMCAGDAGEEVFRCDLDGTRFNRTCSVEVGRLNRGTRGWTFACTARGSAGPLERKYGA